MVYGYVGLVLAISTLAGKLKLVGEEGALVLWCCLVILVNGYDYLIPYMRASEKVPDGL